MAAGRSAILSVKILTDASKAQKGLDSSASSFDKFGAGVKRAAVPAAVALAAVTAAAVQVVAKAEAAATSNARLTNVFRSMGDTTGRAADEAIRYAEALARQTGIDANTVKLTQAKLATFSAVSDESARMAGTFDRATLAAADLAAAGFGSMESNAVQLGKALQDPTKGLTALSKSGVTFTAVEREQIKAMQAAGDMAGAQAVILKAVETQVGGTAVATANASDKMKEGWSQAQAALGELLLPALEVVSQLVGKFSDTVKDNRTAVVAVAVVIATLAAGILALNVALQVYKVVQMAATVATWASNAAWLANPITWIVLAIVAAIALLVAAFVWAWNNSETFRKVVTAVFDGLKAAVGWLVAAFQAAGRAISGVWDGITSAVRSAVDWIAQKIAWLMDKLNAVKRLIPGLSASASFLYAPTLSPAAAGYARGSTYVNRSRTVNVSGAIDPVSTARQLRRILGDDDKRMGRP